MFDMFDSSNKGWLAKLIEEVEEDIVEEEEVEIAVAIVAAIVESELVEIVFGSDTMKKIELRLNWSKQDYTITKRTREWKKSKNRERRRKRVLVFSVKACLVIFITSLSIYTWN